MQIQLTWDTRRSVGLAKAAIDALGFGTALALVDALLAAQMTGEWERVVGDPVSFGRSITWLSFFYALGVLGAIVLLRSRARVAGIVVAAIVLGLGAFWLNRTLRGWELLLFVVVLSAAAAALGAFSSWCLRRSLLPLFAARGLAAIFVLAAVVSHASSPWQKAQVASLWPLQSQLAGREFLGKPNIVLFTLDTLRPDHLAPYGYAFINTPNIGRVAEEGAVFETAVAQAPITSVSHASLFTGLLPVRHGLRSFESQLAEPAAALTLARQLKAAGYMTGAIVASAALSPFYGLDAGFDLYYQISSDYYYPFTSCKRAVLPWALDKIGVVPDRNDYRPHAAITNDALRFLDAYADRPFFLWIHYFDAHSPYRAGRSYLRREHHPGKRFFDRFRVAYQYDAEIVGVDTGVGRVIDALETRGILDRTIVAIVADHGEGLGEHSYIGHARRIYEEQLRIPLILRYPDRIPAGRRVETQVRGMDLMPTLLELIEAPVPPGLDGESLLPILDGVGVAPDRFSFAEVFMDQDRIHLLAASDGRYKLIRDQSGRVELFDLERDPGEQIDLSEQRPEIRDRLAAILDGYLERANNTNSGRDKPSLDDSLRDQLRALGYMR